MLSTFPIDVLHTRGNIWDHLGGNIAFFVEFCGVNFSGGLQGQGVWGNGISLTPVRTNEDAPSLS